MNNLQQKLLPIAVMLIVTAVRASGADDFVLAGPDPDILYTHRHVDGHDLYFVINNAAVPKWIHPRLRVPGPYVLYRPLAGTMDKPQSVGELHLDGFEGIVLVTWPKKTN